MELVIQNTFFNFVEVDDDNCKGAILTCPAQVESDMFKLEGKPVEDMVECGGAVTFLIGRAVANPGVTCLQGEGETQEHNLRLLKFLSTKGSSPERVVNERRHAAFGTEVIADDGVQILLVGAAIGNPDEAYESDQGNDRAHNVKLWNFLWEKGDSLQGIVSNKRLNTFWCDLHGFRIGQQVFWNQRDGNLGRHGVVKECSEYFGSPCLLIHFKGFDYHTRCRDLAVLDPKLHRKPAEARPGTEQTGKDSKRAAVEVKDPVDDTVCAESMDVISATPDLPENGTEHSHVTKGREYARRQRFNREQRLIFRRRRRDTRKELKLQQIQEELRQAAEEMKLLDERHDATSDMICFFIAACYFFAKPSSSRHLLSSRPLSTPKVEGDMPFCFP